MRVIILAGGLGKKLEPITQTRPKTMIEICGKPLLGRLISCLQSVGINQLEIVVGKYGEKIKQFCRENLLSDLSFHFASQKKPSGTGDALLTISERISPSDYFLLIFGDILFSGNLFNSLLNSFRSHRKPLAAVCLTQHSGDFGNIYMDHEMRITEIIEKPQRKDLGNYILAGAFILPGTIMNYLYEHQGNFIEALLQLSRQEGLFASIWEKNWIDLGFPWDILTANQLVMKEWTESRIAADLIQENGSQIQGPVVIEAGVTIKAGAHIIGPCYIGAGSFIGHNALIRDYTSIGARSIVGYGVEMKNSVQFKSAEIGRLSFIGDSVIGENVNIGSGTVMVNINLDHTNVRVKIEEIEVDSGLLKLGTLVGDNAWIGAGHTFLPGTKIPSSTTIPHHSTLPNTF